MSKKDLVKIICDNPGCYAVVDNDCWVLYREDPYSKSEDDADYYEWEENNELARDGEVIPRGGGYGSGCCYGGDILQALAEIVGVKIESV